MAFKDSEVQIKMFGPMQVENQFGVVGESNRPTQAWTILKYLMVHRDRAVYMKEMLTVVWDTEEEAGYNSFRVRLKRLRDALKPLRLEGRKGLIIETAGLFRLNPEYNIQTDADRFDILMKKIRSSPVEDPEGLVLCEEALNLYRGEFLGNVQGDWLQELRERYQSEFRYLLQTALERTKYLKDLTAVPILNSRVAAMAPNDELHKEIACMATQIKVTHVSERYVNAGMRGKGRKTGTGRKTENIKDASQEITHVSLFGQLEMSNRLGQIKETPFAGAQNWVFLKYLLVNREREVSPIEIEKVIWTKSNREKSDVAIRVAVNRLRKMLKPLQLDGTKGLVNMKGGFFRLNPKCGLKTDEEQFLALVEEIRCTDIKEQKGLDLCVQALELFRGKYLENTQEYVWLVQRRESLNTELCILIRSTLERMEALEDYSAISLVSSRAAAIVPEEQQLHDEIIRFMMNQKLQELLIEYVTQLVKNQKELLCEKKENTEEQDTGQTFHILEENEVVVNPFGALVLKTRCGIVTEEPRQSPEVLTMLKYLLMQRGRKVSEQQLRQALLPNEFTGDTTNTLKLRYRRANKMLEPLGLDKTCRLLQCEDNMYGVNQIFTLHMEENQFREQMCLIRQLQNDDPEGLSACVRALEIYRGTFMQYTEDVPWIREERARYQQDFHELAHSTLARMRVLGDASAAGLLGQRVAKLMPQEKEFHRELITLMMEHKRLTGLKDFFAALV